MYCLLKITKSENKMHYFSKLTEYAIRALIVMAGEKYWRMQVKTICEIDPLPLHFTRKAMQILAQNKILKAYKGPTGGYKLNKKPEEIKLFDVIQIFEPSQTSNSCVIGEYHCAPKRPCSLRGLIEVTEKDFIRKLKNISIADLTYKTF
ncbi:MAG: transcriptional regulator, BadM/Rrf2 family [uncultured bacterium]|nr:MAG: transcriptional regulator, BadM/Rrf2 family [uncultured bacterium]